MTNINTQIGGVNNQFFCGSLEVPTGLPAGSKIQTWILKDLYWQVTQTCGYGYL